MAMLNTPPLGTPIVQGENVSIVWHRFFMDLKDSIDNTMGMVISGSGEAGNTNRTDEENFVLMGIIGTL